MKGDASLFAVTFSFTVQPSPSSSFTSVANFGDAAQFAGSSNFITQIIQPAAVPAQSPVLDFRA